ncbi:MAG: hypothetical protein D6722_28320, partial [Bacteroidetes bacterium]
MLQVWNEEGWAFIDSTDGSVFDLRGHNGSIYAFGRFDSIGGIAARMVARWDGTQWDTVAPPFPIPPNSQTLFACGAFYKGHMYVGGNFMAEGRTDMNDIARWEPDSGQWASVGGGLSGGMTWVQDMLIYDSLLVVAGTFSTSAFGDPGEGVIAWDGEQWIPMGLGLDGSVRDLHIHQGQLYAAGVFTLSPNGQAEVLARWTGVTWEALPGLEGNGLSTLASMDGQLYMGGGFMFFGDHEYINIASYGPLGVSTAASPQLG